MKHRPAFLPAALAAALSAACGTTPTAESRAWITILEARHLELAAEVTSIPNFRVDSFKVVDALRVVVGVGSPTTHMVTLREPCDGIEAAQRLGFTTATGALVRGDKLFPVGLQRGPAACVVERMHALKPSRIKP
jgi:Family of unknown function (DUF6491)